MEMSIIVLISHNINKYQKCFHYKKVPNKVILLKQNIKLFDFFTNLILIFLKL